MWMFSGDVTVSDAGYFFHPNLPMLHKELSNFGEPNFLFGRGLKRFILQLLLYFLEKLIKYSRMFSGAVICWQIAAEKFT